MKYLFILIIFIAKLQFCYCQEKLDLNKIANAELKDHVGSSIGDPIIFMPEELEENWKKFTSDKEFKILIANLDKKGFVRIKDAKWGFKGTVLENKKKVDALFCVFDCVNKKNPNIIASVIWRKVGKSSYKAYLLFPEEGKTLDEKLDKKEEWYIASNGDIKKANSWGTCFKKCVKRGVIVPGLEQELGGNKSKIKIGDKTITVTCDGVCYTSALACTAIAFGAAIIAVPLIEAPPVAIAVVLGGIAASFMCMVGGCGPCLATCALGCIN